jgi:hypothetical protein
MLIERISAVSGERRTKEIDVTPEQLKRLEDGEPVQEVLAHLSDEDRNFVVLGATAEEVAVWVLALMEAEEKKDV